MVKNRTNEKLDLADLLTKWVGTKLSLVVHTILFISIFSLQIFDIPLDKILLILTTFLSIEAIYLAIFIQITVNKNTESLREVEVDIDEIQEDAIEEDIHDKAIEKTLKTIENRLDNLQSDIATVRKQRKNKKASTTIR